MSNPKNLVNMSEGTTVSNTSPQSPTGRALLDSITLDFDPMSFEFKEESPLTSPSDSNQDELLSPSQNVDVVEFFDPFCPVKEESPTDYYPNVMLGQGPEDDSLIDCLSEPQPMSALDEPQMDCLVDPMRGFSETLRFPSSEDLMNNSPDSHHYPNGFNAFNQQVDLLDAPCEGDIGTDVELVGEELGDDLNEKSNELPDFCTESENVDLQNAKYSADGDEMFRVSEEIENRECSFPPSINEPMFDDNQHDFNSQHDVCKSFEDDSSRKSRTSSTSSTHSSKSEKRIYKSSESRKEEVKVSSDGTAKERTLKKDVSKKESTIRETNGFSSHNGVDSTVSLKNSKNAGLDGNLVEDKSSVSLASVTDLKSSFSKSREELEQSELPEVKSSVDRVKVQRTFSQSGQDELCLCKICNKHVYQMEKMKAEKSIFHKNCFRCKECNKLLTVDSYSSNDGDIYCKPHFRQLFQPKARFDGEDAAPSGCFNLKA